MQDETQKPHAEAISAITKTTFASVNQTAIK
jgi:hypothetical protein